ncbi:unnamed protein product [Closterium sp. Yama58-4]|nr:unnamed protein product [Closterium sp. Yama58-4]
MLDERNRVLEGQVNELRRALGVVGERSVATAAVVEERERELIAVKGELAVVKGEVVGVKSELAVVKGEVVGLKAEMIGVKGELVRVKADLAVVKGGLVEHKDAMIERLHMAEERREFNLRELQEEARKGDKEMRAGLARERGERRREVQEELEGLGAWKEGQRIQDLKLNLALEIRQSKGTRKKALEAIKSASQKSNLKLNTLHEGLSDAILGHVSTMTHLKSIDLSFSSGFSAEGIKRLYRLSQLEKLYLTCTCVSDSALEDVGSLVSLRELHLLLTKVTDAGLAHLTGLSSLRVLVFGNNKGVTDAGMVYVGRLTKLEGLCLGGTAVTDDGLQQLTALTKLTRLFTPERVQLENDDVRRRIGM